MTRLYSNENFPQPAVDALRAFGHDVLTTSDSGKAGLRISDEEVLAFATAEARILVTYNRKHFIRLHNDNSNHAGIIVCTVDPDTKALAERIHKELEANPDMNGKLMRVNQPNS